MPHITEPCGAGVKIVRIDRASAKEWMTTTQDDGIPRKKFSLPEEIDGKKVVALGKDAFRSLDADVAIIHIPRWTDAIDRETFAESECLPALRAIEVDKENQSYMSDKGVLFDKAQKTLIRYPQVKPGDAYKIPDGVETVRRHAFRYCEGELKRIEVPASCTNIENWAFRNCYSLQEINIDSGNPQYQSIDGVFFRRVNKTFFKSVVGTFFGEIVNGAVESQSQDRPLILRHYPLGKETKEYEIPKNVVEIEEWAFNWRGPSVVTVPRTVKRIGNHAFWSCPNLSKVTISEGVELLESSVFARCRELETIEIPGTVKSIGKKAFFQCVKLENATLGEGVKKIGKFAFAGCAALETMTIPASVEKIGAAAFAKCAALRDVAIPEGVRKIGSLAFAWCDSLRVVNVPRSVQKIGEEAFAPAENVRLRVYEDSYAHRWAEFYEYPFTIIEE